MSKIADYSFNFGFYVGVPASQKRIMYDEAPKNNSC